MNTLLQESHTSTFRPEAFTFLTRHSWVGDIRGNALQEIMTVQTIGNTVYKRRLQIPLACTGLHAILQSLF